MAYDVELAKLSPGDVLLKRLFEQAQAEDAQSFDFTIGEEPYKLRFATDVRQIVSLHVTDSRALAVARRARAMARHHLISIINKKGA